MKRAKPRAAGIAGMRVFVCQKILKAVICNDCIGVAGMRVSAG